MSRFRFGPMKRCDVWVREEAVDEIRELASRSNVTRAEVFRTVVDLGLFILTGDVDRLEPRAALAGVVSLPDARERRERMQRSCGHSIVAHGKCSWCGKKLPAVDDELGEPA
jgi:hypothetical protein